MINFLDNLLRHLFLTQLTDINTTDQVSFRPPDEEWRNAVVGLQGLALNVYLADLRENRKLRSNQRVRLGVENGQVMQQQAPTRMDCHYLISAWSPAQASLEPTVDEHALLYQATAVLMNNVPLNPTRIYGPSSPVLPTVPELIRDAELPTQILPVEGFLKLAEFWGTMGINHRWKPAVYLVVTLPVVLLKQISGPMVTTLITEYRQHGKPQTAEIRIQIGGHVQQPGTPLALAQGSATVTAVNGPGTTVTVDNAAPFRAGDTLTADGVARATLTAVTTNNLTLATPLPGLAAGNSVRIADLTPAQATVRLAGTTGAQTGMAALLRGEDAANPGTAVTERVMLSVVNPASGFVALGGPPRTRTIRLAPAAAIAPTATPLRLAAGAWVRLEDNAGASVQTATTDEDGRFRFENLRQGQYALRVRAPGFAELTHPIEVPEPSGQYDVELV